MSFKFTVLKCMIAFGYFTVQNMSFKFQIQIGAKRKIPMKVMNTWMNMRSAGGRVEEPPSPHLQFRYPHCVPILVHIWFWTALTILGWYAKEERT